MAHEITVNKVDTDTSFHLTERVMEPFVPPPLTVWRVVLAIVAVAALFALVVTLPISIHG